MDGRPTWTDCDEAGDYVVPNVLSPRDLVFRPDNMDETVPHNIFKYHTSLMVYKTLNGLAPEYLQNLFTKTSEMHSRNLQSVENDDLRVPFARTNYFLKSFSVEGSKQWNSLPTELRQIQTLQSFKSALRSYLLNT